MPKIAFYTLGCKSNQYETEVMKSQVLDKGLEITDFHLPSDIYVINTCTVTGAADKKSRQAIRQARKRNPKSIIIVTGCYSEVAPEEIARIGEADIILRNRDKGEIFKYLSRVGQPLRLTTSEDATLRGLPTRRVRVNLMIEDGCEHFCTYCIVPFARGHVRSKPIEAIVAEAEKFVETRVKEIVLTGINLGAYGKDKTANTRVGRHLMPTVALRGRPTRSGPTTTLPQVIQELSKIEGLLRIRLSSLEPMFITRELIDAIAEIPKVCPHLHIPLQSGDDSILKAMGRNYTAKDFLKLIKYIRKKIKGAAINTDIIVGFPGEGEKEFKNTVRLIKKIKFSRMHIFTFSARKGTPAEKFEGKVSEVEINKRYGILNALRIKYMRAFAKHYKRKDIDILVECRDKKSGLLDGLSPHYVRVLFAGNENLVGKIAKVRIKEIKDESCLA